MSKPILMGVVAAFCMAAISPVAAAAPDPAGTAKAERPDSATASTAEGSAKYCVIETPTGSHIAKKTCHTRKEWLSQGFDPLEK